MTNESQQQRNRTLTPSIANQEAAVPIFFAASYPENPGNCDIIEPTLEPVVRDQSLRGYGS